MKNKETVNCAPAYDIFLSYRRDGGEAMAILLRDRLTAKGYRVFLDVENLNSGSFNTKLFDIIDNCKDFILICSKDGLDRCVNDGDWVRLEIAHALSKGKNIVPVMLRGFIFPDVLPDDIEAVRMQNGVNANSHEYFDAAVDRLADKFLKSVPRLQTAPTAKLTPPKRISKAIIFAITGFLSVSIIAATAAGVIIFLNLDRDLLDSFIHDVLPSIVKDELPPSVTQDQPQIVTNEVISILANDGFYTGEWENDRPHGQGRFEWSGGKFYYEGDWKNGKPEGRGEYIGDFSYGQIRGEDTWDSDAALFLTGWVWLGMTVFYNGQWEDGMMQGIGFFKIDEAFTFEGTLKGSVPWDGNYQVHDPEGKIIMLGKIIDGVVHEEYTTS